MKQKVIEGIEKVAEFWAEKSFRGGMNQNNGDHSPTGGLTAILMNDLSLRAQGEVSDELVLEFQLQLIEQLKSAMSSYGRTLHCDYHPCKMLVDAAKAAGIKDSSMQAFPCKTTTWIDDEGKVTASYQYGGKIQTL